LLDFTHTTDLVKGSAVKHNDKEIETMRTREPDRFSSLLFGIGLGASVALVAALLARKGTRDVLRERSGKSLDYLNQQAAKLREAADALAKRAKDFVGPPRDRVKTGSETERQAYQEDKRDILGG
jgi:gas vesicle protein